MLAVVGCLHTTWKNEITQCNEMTILTNSFVSTLHALLFWLKSKLWMYVSSWITSY